MYKRAAGAAVAASFAVAGLAPVTVAQAATVPSKFITKAQVPTTPRFGPWNHTPVITGVRYREDCQQKAVPRLTTKHRTVYNDDQGQQITEYAVRMPTVADARRLVARLTHCNSKAFADTQQHDRAGEGTVTYSTYGRFAIENGLLARAVRNRGGEFPGRVFLDAVGRDGRYVMLMRRPFETEGAAPKDIWIQLSKRALKQLRP